DEEIVLAVDLSGTRSAGGRRHREQDLGMVLLDVRRDRALSDRRGAGEHDETTAALARLGLRPACVEEASQRDTLPCAEAAQALDGRDVEVGEDAVAF